MKTSTILGIAGVLAGQTFRSRKAKILLIALEVGVLVYAYFKDEKRNEIPRIE